MKKQMAKIARSAFARGTIVLLAAWSVACAPAEPARVVASPVAARTTPSLAAEQDPLVAGPTGFFRSKRFDLRVPFPDGSSFKIDDTRGPWIVARHDASRSTLVVRRWKEPELMNHETCEAKARSLRALPSLDDAEIIESRTFQIPPNHDTTATVALIHAPARKAVVSPAGSPAGSSPGTSAPADPAPLYGVVLAFGGYAHDCFAYAFVTQAGGKDAETIVAARLARVVDGSLARVESRSDLDPSLERDAKGR